jgi:hypothetical protein
MHPRLEQDGTYIELTAHCKPFLATHHRTVLDLSYPEQRRRRLGFFSPMLQRFGSPASATATKKKGQAPHQLGGDGEEMVEPAS